MLLDMNVPILHHLYMMISTHLALEKADSLPGLLGRLWKLGSPVPVAS